MQRNCMRLLNKVPTNKGLLYGCGKVSPVNYPPVQLQQSRNVLTPMRSFGPDVFRDTMRDMDRHFRNFERDMNSVLREVNREVGFSRLGSFLDSIAPEITALQPQIVKEGEQNKFLYTLPIGRDVNPENVKVTLKDRMVTIESKYEKKSEDGKTRVYQETTRSFSLPEQIQEKDVKSLLTPEGYLVIEAPLPAGALEEPKPKEIPILKA